MAKAPTKAESMKARIAALPVPSAGARIHFLPDAGVKGFGVKVLASGARAYLIDYRTGDGKQRRKVIGDAAKMTPADAVQEAERLRGLVVNGTDPVEEKRADKRAKAEAAIAEETAKATAVAEEAARPDVNRLIDRFDAEHVSKKRESTARDYRSLIRKYIRPGLGERKVAEVTPEDIEKLHAAIAETASYQANRTAAVLSKAFNLAVKWKLCAVNPVAGLERAKEYKRQTFLQTAQAKALVEALDSHGARISADCIKLLLLTGARRGEALSMKWQDIDFDRALWNKPYASTKQDRDHSIPLSTLAVALLKDIEARNPAGCPWVFPGDVTKDATGRMVHQHLTDVKKSWGAVCRKAGLSKEEIVTDENGQPVADKNGKVRTVWNATVRLHDLRHSYASFLAQQGMSLVAIGRALGHSQPSTTNRYAHLRAEDLRKGAEGVGAMFGGEPAKPQA